MKKIIICTSILILGLTACKNNNNTARQSVTNPVQEVSEQSFVLPEIPVMYTDPEQRAEYMAKHYWDNFDFSDITSINNTEMVEQAWVDFINVLTYVPMEVATTSIRNVFEKAQSAPTVYTHFTTLADKYLYDPNSPFRNEEFYIPVLKTMVSTDILTDTDKIRPTDRLKMAMKNRLGAPAADFTYTLASGKQGTLHKLNADFTILYFNNPGCHACEEITNNMRNSIQIQSLLSNKKLAILAIYPDEDLDEWRRHLNDFPKDWINAYDNSENIRMDNLYDLKAIPTLYLLDGNKNVLIKDGTFEQIENYLRQLNA